MRYSDTMSNKKNKNLTGKRATPLSKEGEAVVTLLKTVDYINRISTETMDPFDITSQQYNILRILRGAGKEGLPTLELAKRMLVHSPGITRLIDRLEKKQMVARERSGTDRRVVHCRITEQGLELLKKMDQPVADMNRRIVQNLNQKQLEHLIELLNQMRKRTTSV